MSDRKGEKVTMATFGLSVKKVASLLTMVIILIVSAKILPIGNMVLLGVGAAILHTIRNYRFTGWITAVACPMLYALSAAIDTPEAGNLYVYYFFSYLAIIIICCIVEEHRTSLNKSSDE